MLNKVKELSGIHRLQISAKHSKLKTGNKNKQEQSVRVVDCIDATLMESASVAGTQKTETKWHRSLSLSLSLSLSQSLTLSLSLYLSVSKRNKLSRWKGCWLLQLIQSVCVTELTNYSFWCIFNSIDCLLFDNG